MNNNYLDFIAEQGSSLINHVSLANGSAMNGEISVTRQSIEWTEAEDGTVTIDGDVEFEVISGSTVNHIQFWDDIVGGTFYGSVPVTEEVFGGPGIYRIILGQIQHVSGDAE
jgi:hypothetical protein